MLVVTAAALFLGTGGLQADISLPGQVAPQADAQTARVLSGGRTLVPLRAHYGGGGSVTFWIVQRPEHGTLSELRLLGDNRATIVYQHDSTRAGTSDHFIYAVKTSSGRVSTPAEVRILIEEPPARLQVPEKIVFDRIIAGTTQTRQLPIRNEGGGVLAGRLTASAPWQLSWSEYRVPAGKTEIVTVIFQPDEGRECVGQITLTGDDGSQRAVLLEGSATSPIKLEPTYLQIDFQDGKSEPRRGTAALTNQTDAPLQLKFSTSRHVKPIPEVELQPRETKTIAIVLLPHQSVAVQEEIAVKGEGFMARLAIDSAATIPTKLASTTETPAAQQPARSPSESTPIPSPPPQDTTRPAEISAPTASSPGNLLVPVRAQRLKDSEWELAWRSPKSPVSKYRVEERELALDPSGDLQITWREIPTAVIAVSGDFTSVRMKGFDAKQLHVVRITAVAADGSILWESPLVPLAPPRAASHYKSWWLLILGTALVVLLVWRWRVRAAAV